MPLFQSLVLVGALLNTPNAALTPDQLKPLQATPIDLGAIHGSAFYVPDALGFHMLATLDTGHGSPIRVSATLTDGQSASLSMPGQAGEPAMDITFQRNGDQLRVRQAVAPFASAAASIR